MAPAVAGGVIAYEDLFEVIDQDPDGKKFDKVSRFRPPGRKSRGRFPHTKSGKLPFARHFGVIVLCGTNRRR